MFYKILKDLREEKNLTQNELAKLICVSRSSINAYENNSNDPSLDVLIKIADFFNVSLDYLLGRTMERTNLNLLPDKDRELVSQLHSIIKNYNSKK